MCSLIIEQIGQYQIVPYWRSESRWMITGTGPDTRSQKFTVGLLRDGRWQTALVNSGERIPPRKSFQAKNRDQAIRLAELHWFGRGSFFPLEGPEIGNAFAEWLDDHPVKQSTIDDDYLRRSEQARAWFEGKGLVYWSDIRSKHLQQYANACAKMGNTRRTIQLRCRVVTMAAKFVRRNYPTHYYLLEYDLPNGIAGNRRKKHPRFRLEEAVEFLFFLRDQPCGWNILSGVTRSALCSLRVPEVWNMTWEKVDLERGLVMVTEWLKNQQSERTIPMPALAWDILAEGKKRAGGSLVMETHKRHGYRQAFNRYRDRWRPGLKLTPSGLRRILRTEFFFRKWDSEVLQVYRGHKPSKVSDVDWQHYIDDDPEGSVQMFREYVTDPLDGVLRSFRHRWHGTEDNLISLPA